MATKENEITFKPRNTDEEGKGREENRTKLLQKKKKKNSKLKQRNR